jgi:nitroimidazol reductase NimA-like FMN-containing flavoprotein (pyridoxamine 5'-phosphate oxidase superfamily)
MYGELKDHEIEALLARHRYGRLGFALDGQLYIIPINYGYANGILYGHASVGSDLYGHATLGTKVRGMRQNPTVAFEVDEIQDAAHWRSVLLHGRFVEVHDKDQQKDAFNHIVAQAGGGERSEVSWALDLEHLVVFRIEVTARTGRFEEREVFALRPGPRGPLPPATHTPSPETGAANAERPSD